MDVFLLFIILISSIVGISYGLSENEREFNRKMRRMDERIENMKIKYR